MVYGSLLTYLDLRLLVPLGASGDDKFPSDSVTVVL